MPNPSMLEREAEPEPRLSLDKWRQLAAADPRWKLPHEILALVAEAIATERERCIAAVADCMSNEGTDDPHRALQWAVDAIRAG